MGVKKCPNCAEEIQEEAKYCIHCNKDINKYSYKNIEFKVKIIIFIIFTTIILWLAFDPQSLMKIILGDAIGK